jgi:hypothetical protein
VRERLLGGLEILEHEPGGFPHLDQIWVPDARRSARPREARNRTRSRHDPVPGVASRTRKAAPETSHLLPVIPDSFRRSQSASSSWWRSGNPTSPRPRGWLACPSRHAVPEPHLVEEHGRVPSIPAGSTKKRQ